MWRAPDTSLVDRVILQGSSTHSTARSVASVARMQGSIRFGIVAAVSIAVLLSGGVTSAAAERPAVHGVAPPSNCIETNDAGVQVWYGEADPEVLQVGDELQAAVDDSPERMTGVAFCSRYDGVVLFVAATDSAVQAVAEKVQGAHPAIPVYLSEVGSSLSSLLRTVDIFLDDSSLAGTVTAVGPDIYTGGVRVSIVEDSQRQVDLTKAAVSAAAGRTIPVTISEGGAGELTGRFNDSAPYYMGGALTNASGGLICSSGVPMTIGSTRRLLTAGHCSGSTYYNNGGVVGSTYTTAFPGNADIYGDWKLVQGSTYAKRVFNGSVSSGSSLPINGAAWGGRPNGYQICSSGAVTGQICRYFVIGSYQSQVLDGVMVGHLLEMIHDSTGSGYQNDSAGWKKGDSGGTCYYADGLGGVIVNGITSGTWKPPAGGPYYYCTQLSGVRAWSPGATF